MNRLERVFDEVGRGRRGLLPYVTAGYPDVQTTCEILRGLDARRCLCVELGIPFSDPIADGPVIQASFSRALEGGFRLEALLEALERVCEEIAVPVLAMVSYSIVYRREPAAFLRSLRRAGFDGVIVPDLALEEADELARLAGENGCSLVMMVAPTTEAERRARIARLSAPFIYYQSVAGVTGVRDRLPTGLAERVEQLRADSGKPVCVGFGISRAEHVSQVCAVADGAIVGSAIVRRMSEVIDAGAPGPEVAAAVHALVESLTAGLPEDRLSPEAGVSPGP